MKIIPGEEYEGVINFREPFISFSLLEGGKNRISLNEIIEITTTEYYTKKDPWVNRAIIKKTDGRLLNAVFSEFTAEERYQISQLKVYTQDLGEISIFSPKRIILNSVERVKCPNCWETMEIDWNYCPYCGTKLNTDGGPRKPVSNPTSSRSPNNTNTEEIVRKGNLKLVITTPLTAVFSLGRKDLIVTLDGPATFEETISDVPTAHPEVVEFNNIPQGTYTVTATYGNKEISKQIQVSKDTLEFQMVMH